MIHYSRDVVVMHNEEERFDYMLWPKTRLITCPNRVAQHGEPHATQSFVSKS